MLGGWRGQFGGGHPDDAALDGASAVPMRSRSDPLKTALGKPTDVIIDLTSRWPLPRSSSCGTYRHRAAGHGRGRALALWPARSSSPVQAHPTACTTYLDHLVHGRIAVKPGIQRLLRGQARRLHRRQRGGDRPHRLRDRLPSQLPLHGRIPCRLPTRPAIPGSSSTPSTASSTICSSPGLVQPAEGGARQLADYQSAADRQFHLGLRQRSKRAHWFRKLKATART